MMARSEQIDPASHEILNRSVQATATAKKNLRALQIDD
jgi:hypothetical protein